MHIHSLEHTDLGILTDTFNKAFEGYFVPLQLSAKQLQAKIKSENILLEYSVGVTVDGELGGFILIGIDTVNQTAYNAGTGVAPKFRGRRKTEKMYAYLFPLLNGIGIKTHLLEVICQNGNALKIYNKLGYSISRKLISYKGTVVKPDSVDNEIESIQLSGEDQVKPFWNYRPSYQNSFFCITNNLEKHKIIGKLCNGKISGYLIFTEDTLRIKQFGVNSDFRRTGIGHNLFYEVQKLDPEKEILIINVDESDSKTNTFLRKIGLVPFIEQFEMKLTVR